MSRPITRDGPTPMEIESTQCRGPLSDAEKQQRRAHRLCLYCGSPGHIAVNCPHKPRRQVYQVHMKALLRVPLLLLITYVSLIAHAMRIDSMSLAN